jgi:hypothetical protein
VSDLHTDDLGASDVAWPLEAPTRIALAAIKLVDGDGERAMSRDELRALGLRLMRSGPPVGWLGAMLLMSCNRTSADLSAGRERGAEGGAAGAREPLPGRSSAEEIDPRRSDFNSIKGGSTMTRAESVDIESSRE